MKNRIILLLPALLLPCFHATGAWAKGHGEIIGHAQAVWCGGPLITEIGGCFVYSIPVLVSIYSENGLVAEVASDAVGNFTISNLKPGNYMVVASAAIPPPIYFLTYWPAALTVSLENKDTVSMDAVLNVVPAR